MPGALVPSTRGHDGRWSCRKSVLPIVNRLNRAGGSCTHRNRRGYSRMPSFPSTQAAKPDSKTGGPADSPIASPRGESVRRVGALPSKNSTVDAIRRECRIRLHSFLLHAVCCTTQGRSINRRGSALPLDRALVLGSQRGPGHHHPSARVMLVEPPRRRPLAGRATAPALAVQQTAPPLSQEPHGGTVVHMHLINLYGLLYMYQV